MLVQFKQCPRLFKRPCCWVIMGAIIVLILAISITAVYLSPQITPSFAEECPKWNLFLNYVTGRRGEKCCIDIAFGNDSQICYSNKAGSPWENVNQLPDCVKDLQPEFFVYTPEQYAPKQDSELNQSFTYGNMTQGVEKLVLEKNRYFYVIVHGFHTKFRANNWMVLMKNELIDLGHNVMIVKWDKGSNIKSYVKAAANTRTVGSAIINVMQYLLDKKKINLDMVTFIGFSLGAHISGYVGSKIAGLPRIIALDPAGPLFACGNLGMRLDPSDAKFVQVLHTNGETFLKGGMGTIQQLGHVDFYANGGLKQPFCGSAITKMAKKIVKFDFSSMKDISCSHGFAPKILTEMIQRYKNRQDPKECKFDTFTCSDYESWKHGKCFSCPEPNQQCPEPGLALFDQQATPVIDKNRYFFNTPRDVNETGKFCGRHWLLSIISQKKAKGSIFVELIDKNGQKSDRLMFHKEYYILNSNEPSKKIVVGPWAITDLEKVVLTYEKYSSVIWFDGPKTYNLVNITMMDKYGNKFTNKNPITLNDKKSETVDMIRFN